MKICKHWRDYGFDDGGERCKRNSWRSEPACCSGWSNTCEDKVADERCAEEVADEEKEM